MTLFVALGLLVLVSVVNAGVSMHNEFYCYSTDPIRPLTRMHSTRTSYEAVRRTSIDPDVSSCSVSRIWFVARQGGQIPLRNMLENMIEFAESSIQADIASNFNAGRTTLCRQDFEAIGNWTINSNYTIENADLATEGSTVTMQNLARRYQQYFPTVLTEDYSHDRFNFRYSVTRPASNESIRAFTRGLFGENESENVIFENVPDRDWLLAPTNNCPAYSDEIANQHQLDAFRRGPEFEEMMEQVNRKLGFHGSNQLSVDTVLVMWEWCTRLTGNSFELSDSEIGEDIAWCAPFSIAHHLLLEYHDDLKYFYTYGYGVRNQRLIENLNCGLVQDLLTHMRSNNNTDQTVRVFVSNGAQLLTMMVTFGLLRDTWPLHQHNFAQQTERHWASTFIVPHAGQLVVVRYDCADGDHDLLFLLNERPILIPGCGANGICKLSFILSRFERFIDANCEALFCSSD